MLNDPINLVDPFGLKGGALIPIRNAIKKNATAGDIIGPSVEKIIGIPLKPLGIFLYIMAPTDAGDAYLDEFMTLPQQVPSIYFTNTLEDINRKLSSNPCEGK